MACIRTCCQRLVSGRFSEADVPLISAEGTLNEETAREVLQQYEQLQPKLRAALASRCCSDLSVQWIKVHFEEIQRNLEEIAETGETSLHCNVSVNGTWEMRNLVLRPEGFALRNGNGPPQLVPWSNVSSLGHPPPGASLTRQLPRAFGRLADFVGLRRRRWRRNQREIEMQLPNRQVILQFGEECTYELMQRYWEASRDSFSMGPGTRVLPLRDLLRECHRGNMLGFEMFSIYETPLKLNSDLHEVWQQLSQNGPSNILQRMHGATKAEDMQSWDWVEDEQTAGLMKCIQFKQNLPRGFAGPYTNVSVVYHLENLHPNELILHQATKCWEVPYKDDFQVYHKYTFSGDVSLQIDLGIFWKGSLVSAWGAAWFKQIILNGAKSASKGSGDALANIIGVS